ncbi:MAG: FAD-dependent monooxygenase [Hyphomicrobiaceae bacterium]|nr:FAD-dependent monooxygenase [Hyphomicrobiaceae bacterium]
MTILISGGGIGGLSSAIALAQSGQSCHVLEQADAFSEIGAGIQIGPNGMKLLAKWGLRDLLQDKGATPAQVRISDGLSGNFLNSVPLGPYAEQRYGAPYKVFHRAELQSALLQKAQSLPEITITTGFKVEKFTEHQGHIDVSGANGQTQEGRLLIGCDGLWSNTRSQIYPQRKPIFYGKSAWRAIVPRATAPAPFNKLETGLWMAPNAHLVHYPVLKGEAINVVAVISEHFDTQDWSTPGQRKDLLAHYESWHKSPRDFLNGITGWQKWALHALAPIPCWSQGRVTLLGDAAHPPIPFLAQGGVMALEDAFVLAQQLDHYGEDHASAFQQYESLRRKRAYKVMKTAHKLGKIYHMKGFLRLARNTVLKAKQPEKLLSSYDWLYGF